MTRREFWWGVVVVLVVLFGGLELQLRRWEYVSLGQGLIVLRVDHWTGEAVYGGVTNGRWQPVK